MRLAFHVVAITSLFLMLGGCGSVSENQADASTDASDTDGGGGNADASEPDAQTMGMVTVRVVDETGPLENVAVMYHEPDGSYIGSMLSDSNGEVVISDIPVNGMVTAPVSPFGDIGSTTQILSSVTGVQIGDVITIGGSVNFEDDGDTVGEVNVTLPASGQPGGATRYEVRAACSTRSSTTVGATLSPAPQEACVPASNEIDVVAFAEDDQGTRLAYTSATVTLTGTAPDLTGAVTLPSWQQPVAAFDLTSTDAPGITTANFQMKGLKGGIEVDEFVGDEETINQGDSSTQILGVIPDFYDETIVTAVAELTVGVMDSDVSVTSERVNGGPSTGSPDARSYHLVNDFIQGFTDVTATPSNPPTFTWSNPSLACKDNPTPDSMLAVIIGSVEQLPAGTAPTDEYVWVMLLPGDTQSDPPLPQLDPALAQTLWPSDTFDTTESGIIVKSDSNLTYDDFRVSDQNMALLDFEPDETGTRCLLLGGQLNF